MRLEIHVHHHYDGTAAALRELRAEMRSVFHNLKEAIMVTKDEVLAKLDTAITKITKIGGETSSLVQKITDLQTQIANGAGLEEISAKVDALLGAAQSVDDQVQDLVPEPTPEG